MLLCFVEKLKNTTMKKAINISAISLTTISLAYLFFSTGFLFKPDKTKCITNTHYLLSTHWKQMGGFEKYTPDKLRTGCWSTALAQITFYHQLKPFGQVKYVSRNGYKINENLDSTNFDFNLFTPTIDSLTSKETTNQLAKYNYYAALAMQKDFGTDRYMNKLAPASLLEAHYHMSVERYISFRKVIPYTHSKLEKIIYKELQQQRPLFLHFANLKDFGHSVVIDGYCYDNNKFMVHLNQGQGGKDDGWYDFYKGILRPDDTALRVIYTFKPMQ